MNHRGREALVISVLNNAGFCAFHYAIKRVVDLTDRCLTRAIVKRFWDTSNTFHLPFEEMTMSPLDLAMLTGVDFPEDLLVYREDFHL